MSFSGPARRRTTLRATAAPALVTALAVGLLAGCGADEAPAPVADQSAAASGSAEESDGPRLVQGGEPGEAAEEVPADTTLPANQWTGDDETFYQQMIPHHAQALEMTALVPARSTNRQVRLLAERIEAAQGPEITMMASWLAERDLEVPRNDDGTGHGEHGDHTGMAGMLTPDQMDQLAATSGAAFDRLFLVRMIGHHSGALTMADETAGGGLDVRVGEARDDISASQTAEIGRMRQLLASI